MWKPLVNFFAKVRAVWNERPAQGGATSLPVPAPPAPEPPRWPKRILTPVTNDLLNLLSDTCPDGQFCRVIDVMTSGQLVEHWWAGQELIYRNDKEPYRCRGVYPGDDDVAQRHVLLTERALLLLRRAVVGWLMYHDPGFTDPYKRHEYPAGFSRTILMRSWKAELELFTILCDENAVEP